MQSEVPRLERGLLSRSPELIKLKSLGVKQADFQLVLGHGIDVAVAEQNIEDANMAEGVMGLGGGVGERRPRSARRLRA